ncbi:MAG TPA: ABC transporter, partial [Burkholderiaceae bacterium]|nr:ABC transporter [Burkholderiaceae bacterium]
MSSLPTAAAATPAARLRTSALPTPAKNVRSLSGLTPFLYPYRTRIAWAVVFLVMAAVSTLVFPVALKS